MSSLGFSPSLHALRPYGLGAFLLAFAFPLAPFAEDPLLGIVKEVKCLNCIKDSVVLLVDDPIDGKEMDVMVPARAYNKILTPLRGKRLHAKAEGCFYWLEKIKPIRPAAASLSPSDPDSTGLQDKGKSDPVVQESLCIPFRTSAQGMPP